MKIESLSTANGRTIFGITMIEEIEGEGFNRMEIHLDDGTTLSISPTQSPCGLLVSKETSETLVGD